MCLADFRNDQMERLWKMVMRSYVLCHFNPIKEMNLDFLLLSLSILRTMILLLKSLGKMLLEFCVWSLLVGSDQASNYWKEWCDPQPIPPEARLQPTGGWVDPLWENIWWEGQYGSFPLLLFLLSGVSLFQESIPQTSPSLVLITKNLKRKLCKRIRL